MKNDRLTGALVTLGSLTSAWLLTWLLGVGIGHCEVPRSSAMSRDNGLGAVIEYTNPFIYNFGVIVDGSIVRSEDRTATNLRFQPYGTFELYTEQILLCGPPTDELIKRAHGPVILTYRRRAQDAVRGVGCHELEAVFQVGPQDGDSK